MAWQIGLDPVFNQDSRVLILGSFPSVLSRGNFYYGNPRNRFWTVMGEVLQDTPPCDKEGRTVWLLSHRIALWDLVAACGIQGSSDNDLKNLSSEQINDVRNLVDNSNVTQIFCNGTKSFALLKKYFSNLAGTAILLPSTSPANVSFDAVRWQAVAEFLKK